MNLKKIIIINIIGTYLLTFVTHFLYTIFPNTFTSIFFPVNESIWEHMKMLYTTILLFSIVIYILLFKYKIKYNNYIFSSFFQALIAIPIFLVMFLPYNHFFKENLIIISIFMIITFIIINIIGYKISKLKNNNFLNIISIILIIIMYIIFAYLTYNPIKKPIFYDKKDHKYGINDYVI